MKIFECQGFNDFIICLVYKINCIKQYFLNYYFYNSDITIDIENNSVAVHQTKSEKFNVTLVETGLATKTAGRLKRVREYIGEEDFFLTYGDGVADIDLDGLVAFHKSHGKIATVTAVQPAGRFGLLGLDGHSNVNDFNEKPIGDGGWINGGFFVLKPNIFDYLKDDADEQMWEENPLNNLSNDSQLMAYKHNGFWKCMDAMRDKEELNKLWLSDQAKWKIWA